MEQPAPPAEPTSGDHAKNPADPASRPDPAVEAMAASIERLDALGLEGVEPASTFHWP